MKKMLLTLAVLTLLVSSAQAQLRAFTGSLHNKGETRILLWDGAAGKAAAEVALIYGRPAWKADYEAPGALDSMTKGKVWRAGQNFFTHLDSNVPIKIGGQDVPAGHYYIAIQRSADGSNWMLAFIDPASTRALHMDASEVGARASELTINFTAPLTFNKTSDTTKNLDMIFTTNQDDVKKSFLQIKWGQFELSAPVEVVM